MAGRPSVTMRDVATHAHVSTMTVSRTLRHDPKVSPEARQRVLEAVDALGYRRNELARNLRLGRMDGVLGVCLANLANCFYAQLALGIEEWADRQDMRVVFGDSAEDPQREDRLLQDFAARRLDGVIAVPTSNKHGHFDQARLGGMPVVLAAAPPAGIIADAVLLDDFGGAWDAVRTLINWGHRKIGFLGLPASSWTGSERFRGYSAALEESGIEVDERYVRRGKPTVEAAIHLTMQLLELADPPTAIFGANNRLTIGAYRAAHTCNSGVTLAGFDDLELADLLDRPLLLVSYDAREIGRRAAELLGERLTTPGTDGLTAGRRVVIPTHLVDYHHPSAQRALMCTPRRRRDEHAQEAGRGNSVRRSTTQVAPDVRNGLSE